MSAGFDTDFVQRLDVFGNKRDGDHQQMALPFPRKALERLRQRRLEPFLPADAALKAEQVWVGPAAVMARGGSMLTPRAMTSSPTAKDSASDR